MKKLIYSISIAYMIFILILMVVSLTTLTEKLTFNKIPEYESKIKELKEAINKKEDSTCKESIKTLIDASENTYFVGDIYLKNVYKKINDNEKSFLIIYGKTLNNCNINEILKKEINLYAITATIQYNDLIQKYVFDYELKIIDIKSRNENEASLTSIKSTINKNMELKVIEALIEGGTYE